MNSLVWVALVIVTFIIQASLLPLLSFSGIRPDLLLIVVVSCAILSGREKGVGMGFFAGLLQDLASGTVFGTNTLAKLAVGFSFGLAERKVFKENIILPLMITAAATVIHSLIVLGLLFIFGHRVDFLAAVRYNLLPLVAYNVVLSIPVHQIIFRLTQWTAK